jgi:hypothetical protein
MVQKHPLLRYLFIASLVSIFIQFVSLGFSLVKDHKKELLESAEKIEDFKPEMADQLRELAYEYDTNKYLKVMPYVNLFFLILSTVSVVLMWQLNKKGWYIYLFAEFAPYIISIVTWDDYAKYSALMGGGKSVIAITFITLAFDILFAGMYFYALRETEKLQTLTTSESSTNQDFLDNK